MSAQYSHELSISREAWHIARLLDKLGPGNYTIQVSRPAAESARWTVEISQPVIVVQKREVFDRVKEERKETTGTSC